MKDLKVHKMIIHNFEQGSEEWLNIRVGKFTGSDFHIMLGKSETKDKELDKKASERLTGVKCDQDIFSNGHTKRGHELEPLARDCYFFETGKEIKEVGFVELNDEVGCSPDGLIDDGIIEIKCVDNHTYFKVVRKSYIAPIYKTQIQFNLYVTNRKYCDFIYFNPNFKKNIRIIRVERDDEFIEKIKDCIDDCNNIINQNITQFEKA